MGCMKINLRDKALIINSRLPSVRSLRNLRLSAFRTWIPPDHKMNKGKRQIIQLLNRNVVANVTITRVIQVTCYLASIAVLAFSIWHLAFSELTKLQIALGFLCSSLGPLFFISIGLLLPIVAATDDPQKPDAQF
jgi:hypothetical protein